MAGRIPQDFFDHLLSHIDIVELIDSRVPLRKSGRNYSACCPFHAEKTPSFTVSAEKQFFHCFGCGAHGTAIGFLMEYERLDFLDAVNDLARIAGIEVPHTGGAVTAPSNNSDLFALVEQADNFFRRHLREHPKRQQAVDYLRRRGLDGETAQHFGIGYAPPGWDNLLNTMQTNHISAQQLIDAGLCIKKDSGGSYDRFRERIMFPIRDRRGRTIAFGGRAIGDESGPKYLNSPETAIFHKGRELYGLYEARHSTRQLKRIVIVEGYMDVVALAQHGIKYAVATLGTATSAEHADRLFRTCSELIFCFDGDNAGRSAAWRALENTLPLLRDGRQVKFLFLPDNEDPDSIVRQEGQQAFEQRLEQAQVLSDYFFNHLIAQTDTDSLEARTHLQQAASAHLTKLPAGYFRDQMFAELSRFTKFKSPEPSLPTQGAKTIRATPPYHRAAQKRRSQPLPQRVIALLLYAPELAQCDIDIERLKNIPELALLIELIELFRNKPHITVASVLEHYRASEHEQLLSELATWQPQSQAITAEAEFLDAMNRLQEETVKRLYDRTLKTSLRDLSEEEREMLRNIGKTSSS